MHSITVTPRQLACSSQPLTAPLTSKQIVDWHPPLQALLAARTSAAPALASLLARTQLSARRL